MSSRRDFFKKLTKPISDIKEEETPLYVRPPYAKDLSLFDKECINCESKACAKACDEKIIIIEANRGTPIINFTNSGCTFCQDCANACELNVLSIDFSESINATFLINKDKCMAHNGSVCFSCKEPCIDDAILFKGMFEPIIDIQKCTSCGFCLSRCPTNAIEYIIK